MGLSLADSNSTDSNDTEIYRALRDSNALPCFETNYRLDANVYSEAVVIIDIEEDGELGTGTLTVVPVNVTTEQMYTERTGCPIGT